MALREPCFFLIQKNILDKFIEGIVICSCHPERAVATRDLYRLFDLAKSCRVTSIETRRCLMYRFLTHYGDSE